LLGSQGCTPSAQVGRAELPQLAGSVGLPTHSSHSLQSFWQLGTGVHGRHFVGSALLATSQWFC
jgi:hypothetical protein